MRDRLIELIESARYWGSNTSAEIADRLLANGVIVPPVKVGDEVYVNTNYRAPIKADVVSIHIHEWGNFLRLLFDYPKMNGCFDYRFSHIGKTVFLAREEAEQALAKMKGGE